MRFPKNINFKIVLPLLALAGLGAFLLKDVVFQKKAPEAPIELGGPSAPKKKIVGAPLVGAQKVAAPIKWAGMKPAPPVTAESPRMAIILDDWGTN